MLQPTVQQSGKWPALVGSSAGGREPGTCPVQMTTPGESEWTIAALAPIAREASSA
jgi:hypothetical protein